MLNSAVKSFAHAPHLSADPAAVPSRTTRHISSWQAISQEPTKVNSEEHRMRPALQRASDHMVRPSKSTFPQDSWPRGMTVLHGWTTKALSSVAGLYGIIHSSAAMQQSELKRPAQQSIFALSTVTDGLRSKRGRLGKEGSIHVAALKARQYKNN